MKKMLFMVGVLALLAINIYCGGGGDSSTHSSEVTEVTINLGETRTTSPEQEGILRQTSTVPSNITTIRFTISAPDMVTLQRVVSVAGRTTISESFEVSNGLNRYFLIEAIDASGNVLYRGETTVNLDGRMVSLTIVLASTVQIADLQPTSLVVTSVNASFNVVNNGNADAVNATVWIQETNFCGTICTPTTITVPAGGSQPVNVAVNFPTDVRVMVNPGNTISESDTTNNCLDYTTCTTGCPAPWCTRSLPTTCP